MLTINKQPKNNDLLLFFLAIIIIGFSNSIINAVLNNYLKDNFQLSDMQRGILELPREMPGFLVIGFSALLFFLSNRRLAAVANLISSLGIFLIAFFSHTYSIMLVWLFVFSTGIHLYLPLNHSIGMEFAEHGKFGKRLGQMASISNFAAIAGSLSIFLGFKFLSFTYTISFLIATAGFLIAAAVLFKMKQDKPQPMKTKFILRKKYMLFYWLNILYGMRKQLFITFAPWVLVKEFNQPTQTLASLLFIGGVIGIFFNPLLGKAIDKLGEKTILMTEAAILIFVCLGYGFSQSLFSVSAAIIISFACFIIDNMLISVGMARATYIKKIAHKPEEVSQTITMGVTIDHLFSILIALISGYIWTKLGYKYVFLIGAVIALLNFFSVLLIDQKSLLKNQNQIAADEL